MKVNLLHCCAFLGILTLAAMGVHAGVNPIATFNGDNSVTVNGKPVTPSQPAFAGDTIEVPGSALGVVQFPEQSFAKFSAAARASIEQSGPEFWIGLQRGYVGIREGAQPVSVRVSHSSRRSATPSPSVSVSFQIVGAAET